MTNRYKITFSKGTELGWLSPDGELDLPIDSELAHRFRLVDEVVTDLYDGVTDEEVRDIDHAAVVKAAKENLDHEGNPAPLPEPLPRDYIAPQDAVAPTGGNNL
jgi:hypothetical protein